MKVKSTHHATFSFSIYAVFKSASDIDASDRNVLIFSSLVGKDVSSVTSVIDVEVSKSQIVTSVDVVSAST